MKRLIAMAILATACSTESSVDPAKPATYIRYFNGGNSDQAEALVETPDNGLLILATTTVLNPASGQGTKKIKLIKTDAFGNPLWQQIIPALAAPEAYSASGIAINSEGGYIVVGSDIQQNGTKQLILKVDADGNVLAKYSPKLNHASAAAATIAASGNILVLSYAAPKPETSLMILSEYKKTSLDSVWSVQYPSAGAMTNLINSLFVDAQSKAYWGGTVVKQGSAANSVRFVKTSTNSQNALFDLTLGKPGSIGTSNGLIRFGSNFAMAGSSNTDANGNEASTLNISYKRVDEGGTLLAAKTYPLPNQEGDAVGNGLCVARDGGLVLLGTVKVTGGRGERDYALTKIDAFGNTIWTQIYGSKFDDVGKSIITTEDGGHVFLGTSDLANIKTILLMKVNYNGQIN